MEAILNDLEQCDRPTHHYENILLLRKAAKDALKSEAHAAAWHTTDFSSHRVHMHAFRSKEEEETLIMQTRAARVLGVSCMPI